MATKKVNQNKGPRAGWLRLSLELIAVFVGITAGFFVNNYQESRRDQNLEQKYLESFRTNLVADSLEIQAHIQENQNNLNVSRRAVMAMRGSGLSKDSALAVMQLMATFNNFNMQDATYESIVNSGNLGLIGDYNLKEELVSYYRSRDDIDEVEQVLNNYINDYIIPYLFDKIDLITGDMSDDFDPMSREFKNMTGGYYVLMDQKVDLILDLDSLNHALISNLALHMH
jgi:hypothetical protein